MAKAKTTQQPICLPQYATRRNPDRPTLGPKVARALELLGTPDGRPVHVMPWQRQVLDVAYEIDPDLWDDHQVVRLIYREVRVKVPRQSGKTTLLLGNAVHRARGMPDAVGPRGRFGAQSIIYTAQTRNDAAKKWRDEQIPVLDGSAFARHIDHHRKVNGSEATYFHNGSRYGLTATTKKSGHGGTNDQAHLDEFFAQRDGRLEQGLRPTMITRQSPQTWVYSTAGDHESVPWRTKVEGGRELITRNVGRTSIAYFEWSAPLGLDPLDPATWWLAHPALGYTIDEDAVAAEAEGMDLVEFCRAYLNWWPEHATGGILDLTHWGDLADGPDRDETGEPILGTGSHLFGSFALAWEVSVDGQWAAICAVGDRADGARHLEVLDYRAGSAWVAGEIGRLTELYHPVDVAYDPASPGAQLAPDVATELKRRRLREPGASTKYRKPTPIATRELAAGAATIYTAVNVTPELASIRHLDDPTLNVAVANAAKRPLGDGLWLWHRKASTVDISTLTAMTIALRQWDVKKALAENRKPQVRKLTPRPRRPRKADPT